MATDFFIPKKINVGYQERNGTYTGKLAYIIYFDEKGKLRKETSWNSWRDQKIANEIYDNEPISGFVLNKKAGGYSTGWNHRQTYVRVYDPRGFEFEITIPNLLYILENATSTKGKGLEGEFVYGWDGKDLVLIPVDAPDYKELVRLNELRHAKNFIKAKDLKIGATYRTKSNDEYIYMGKYDEYDRWSRGKQSKKSFYFYERNNGDGSFHTMKTVSQKLVEVISEECVEDYADIFDKLEHKTMYSPIDETKAVYEPYTLEEFEQTIQKRRWVNVYSEFQGKLEKIEVGNFANEPYYYAKEEVEVKNWWDRSGYRKVRKYADTVEEVFNIVKPIRKKIYLANGKYYGEEWNQ